MPSTVFTVQRVDSMPTSTPGVTGHLITGDWASQMFQVHTANDFAAALCQRAKESGQQVSVIWKDGRFGKQLVQVDILDKNEAVA